MTRRGAVAGLDFGMTNSSLCTFGPSKVPKPYIMKGSNNWFVPTVVANTGISRWLERVVDAFRDNFVIGLMARSTPGFAENFKILLPNLGTLEEADRHSRAEFNAASKFLETLFTKFYRDTGNSHFDELVVTVPESWLSGPQLGGVNALKHILSGIGVQNPHILSEPVAAACYFAHLHLQAEGRPFDGHVLIYDHGGSTLDLCVARLGEGQVHTITRVGRSGEEGSLGFGGVQFDNLVFDKVAARNQRIAAVEGEVRARWLHEFEEMKRRSVEEIDQACAPGAPSDVRERPAFNLQSSQTQVRLGELLEVFETYFAGSIRADVEAVLAQAKRFENIDTKLADRFRVVTVGGFSEFPPVQNLLKEIFLKESGTTAVLEAHFVENDDRWLAVAKGACLVASGTSTVKPTCPLTFGVTAYVKTEPHKFPLLELGKPISGYDVKKYLETEFELARLTAPDADSLEFFIDRAGTSIRLRMTQKFHEVLPDFGRASSWRLGCVLDEGTALLCMKSNLGREETISMGNFMSMMEGRLEGTAKAA